ncbi:RNA polymerase sigma-70 factor, ECF subfamily [Methylophilus rhizosphaerae]|uniref:RNA polymerase sigma-70 factor, ECF subfamily n=1 Tax=Methylophilus rhizosphaerae TaxID=492660 RepID=A0A1G8ZEM4_9PROT|nr:RNA polymerase sigma factor [Methylophilus rhizosphaerae]SDK13552.1 RNA polymerase sigma-70 factor, ECF subfamily [Methylophilus rhizosphaerae]
MFWHGINLHWAYTTLLPGIRRKTRCQHMASDILHDGFLRFALTSSPNRAHEPHAYLRTIVQNLLLEQYRRESYFADYQQQADLEEPFTVSVEHLADIKQRLELVTQIIQDLPPRCRQVFVMYRIEGYAQKEIASQLNISLNMVERHLIRALLDIRAAREQFLK